MLFKSTTHRVRFLAAVEQFGHIDQGRIDPEYGTALYLLTSGLAIYEKARPYISRNGILFADMLEETHFSHGEQVLVQLAGNLFGQQIAVSPVEFMILDSGNFAVVQEALRIRYTPPCLGEIAGGQ